VLGKDIRKMNDLNYVMNNIRGKTVRRIREDNYEFSIEFDDGTILTLEAKGTYCDKLWLDVSIEDKENWIE
jgi:hypothetical protein